MQPRLSSSGRKRILCEDGQTKLVMHRMFYLPKQLTWVGFTQEKEVLEAQKRDRWVPKVGSMIFIPRMKGNFKVVSVKGDQVNVQLGALKINVALDEIRRQ
ncbi:g7357 [Coccomyxa viridis]|uniref:G7357 protein n=1 Tax=Coccomyxa viridis TaxID=1274662 RepID=A0ABP1G021_9CHLO